MPTGLDVTVPAPLPGLVTASRIVSSVSLAATLVAPVIVVVQVRPVPVQPPVQPSNLEPVAGVAVKVTAWPKLKPALHVAPQLIPAGTDVTVPAPLPGLVTVSRNGSSVNVAATLIAAVIVV